MLGYAWGRGWDSVGGLTFNRKNMGSPLAYNRGDEKIHSPMGCLHLFMAWVMAFSALFGILLCYFYVVGFGIGDTWVIYPPDVGLLDWAIPLAFLVGPFIWFSWMMIRRFKH